MNKRLKGISTIYTVVTMTGMCAVASLAVDYGRVQVSKTELRRTVDGAARAGAAGIPDGAAEAIALAKQYGSLNNVDTHPLSIQSGDIKFGIWSTTTNTFSTANDFSEVNAIWISSKMDAAHGGAVPLLFAPIFGASNTCQVSGESIAMLVPGLSVDQNIQATANPFLAGMPAGTLASVVNPSPRHIPDVAGTPSNPLNSPQVVNMPLTAGESLTFDSIDGTARHDPGLIFTNPDGDTDDSDGIGHNNSTTVYQNNYGSTMYNENGIADAWIPINAVVGVFLDDNQPNLTPAPANLDFRVPGTTREIQDFTTLQPQLKQLFFIGDGLDANGNHQNFVVPKGATRLYLATMDYYEWNNNAGFREVKVNRPSQIITVK